VGSELLARREALRSRADGIRAAAEGLWLLVEEDRAVRWGAIALVPILWVALAWQEPFILIGVILVCIGIAAAHGFRPIDLPSPDDNFDDWA
jgi:diacylglycerol kinase